MYKNISVAPATDPWCTYDNPGYEEEATWGPIFPDHWKHREHR